MSRPLPKKHMDFSIQYHFITGMMLGIEYAKDEEERATHLVLDLLILRLVFSAYADKE